VAAHERARLTRPPRRHLSGGDFRRMGHGLSDAARGGAGGGGRGRRAHRAAGGARGLGGGGAFAPGDAGAEQDFPAECR